MFRQLGWLVAHDNSDFLNKCDPKPECHKHGHGANLKSLTQLTVTTPETLETSRGNVIGNK